jgi:uncharacterized protein
MLEVTFYRDGSARPAGISARGHADFAEHGKDVVCAAVSAILQAARLGLTEHARAKVTASQSAGELELLWGPDCGESESVRAIVATAELAVDQIARRFPKNVRLRRRRARKARGASSRNG